MDLAQLICPWLVSLLSSARVCVALYLADCRCAFVVFRAAGVSCGHQDVPRDVCKNESYVQVTRALLDNYLPNSTVVSTLK